VPTQTGEIVMDICRIGVSFIDSFSFEEPSPIFKGQKMKVYNRAYELFSPRPISDALRKIRKVVT